MVKRSKKKKWYSRVNRRLLVVAVVVLGLAAAYGMAWLVHDRAVAADKARFTQAGKDVQTVAAQIVAAVGQPQDRKDGGNCSYAHQEFGKGPLTCEVYSYLAYGVNSPDDVNAIVRKAEAVPGLHGSPWKFKAITEKPHQLTGGVSYSDNFVALHDLFDTESKTISYSNPTDKYCGGSFSYFNTISQQSGYPSFNVNGPQTLLIDIDCSSLSRGAFFTITQ